MNTDTLSYSSVIRAFESIGFNSDSCLSEYQYMTALDKLVKRSYPQTSFDNEVARELFQQNEKGIDSTVKISSYAMAVVTAFQILVNRIVTETTNLQISGGQMTKPDSAEILREAQQDSQTLLMAFGEKTTAPPPVSHFPQVGISPQVLYQSAALSNSQVQNPQHPQPPAMMQSIPQPISQPLLQPPPQPIHQMHPLQPMSPLQIHSQPIQPLHPQQHPVYAQPVTAQQQMAQQVQQAKQKQKQKQKQKEMKAKTNPLFTLISLAGTLSLIQLLMSHHKYHFFNLPTSLMSFAIIGSRLRNKAVLKLGQFFYSACIVLSLYWMIEVAVVILLLRKSPKIHALLGHRHAVAAPIVQPTYVNQAGQPVVVGASQQPTPVSVVCIQQPNGQCSFVQAQQIPGVPGSPDPTVGMQGASIAAANPTPTSPKSDMVLQFILFILGDAIKIVALVFLMKAEAVVDEKAKEKENQKKAEIYPVQIGGQPVLVKKVK